MRNPLNQYHPKIRPWDRTRWSCTLDFRTYLLASRLLLSITLLALALGFTVIISNGINQFKLHPPSVKESKKLVRSVNSKDLALRKEISGDNLAWAIWWYFICPLLLALASFIESAFSLYTSIRTEHREIRRPGWELIRILLLLLAFTSLVAVWLNCAVLPTQPRCTQRLTDRVLHSRGLPVAEILVMMVILLILCVSTALAACSWFQERRRGSGREHGIKLTTRGKRRVVGPGRSYAKHGYGY